MKHKNIDDPFYARLHEAEEAGLNKEWALKVAYREISLEDALGAPDMDAESAVEFDPNFSMCDETDSNDDDFCWLCDGKECDCFKVE